MLPAIASLLFFALRIALKAKAPAYIVVGAFVAALSPVAMHIAGTDMHRWDCIAVTTSLLSLYNVCVWVRRERTELPSWVLERERYLPVLIVVVAINASSTTFLFNGELVKQFPFFEHRRYLVGLLQGRERLPFWPPANAPR